MIGDEHVETLFSAAVDEELTAQQHADFQRHLAGCEACARGFAAFRNAVSGVRRLPVARMSLPVHLPSDAPVAERAFTPAVLQRVRGWRFVPGPATGLAAVAAAVIAVLALTHQQAPPGATTANAPNAGSASGATSVASCPVPAAPNAVTPTTFTRRSTATDPSRPGQQLVLATTASTAAPGDSISIFATLDVPAAAAGRPGAAPASLSTHIVPCLGVTGLGAAAGAPGAARPLAGSAESPSHATSPAAATAAGAALQTFTIPAGTPPGTVLHIVATVPANYPAPGNAAVTVDLTITVS